MFFLKIATGLFITNSILNHSFKCLITKSKKVLQVWLESRFYTNTSIPLTILCAPQLEINDGLRVNSAGSVAVCPLSQARHPEHFASSTTFLQLFCISFCKVPNYHIALFWAVEKKATLHTKGPQYTVSMSIPYISPVFLQNSSFLVPSILLY